MRWLRIVGVAAVMVAFPLASFAKGAAGAALEGQGIDGTLVVDQAGELGQGTAMSVFAERAGFFELVFGDGRVQDEPLIVDIEPTIVVKWDMIGAWIVQDLYFQKDGSVVAYVAPGQEFWEDTAKTVGGWMSIKADLIKPLTDLGVDVSALPQKVADREPVPAPKAETPAPEPAPAAPAPVPVEPAPVAPAPVASEGAISAVPILVAALVVGLAGAGLAARRRMLTR